MLSDDMLTFVFVYDARFADALSIQQDSVGKFDILLNVSFEFSDAFACFISRDIVHMICCISYKQYDMDHII